jgi:peptidoglycan/LPS O-acetylase OafA/YrhL
MNHDGSFAGGCGAFGTLFEAPEPDCRPLHCMLGLKANPFPATGQLPRIDPLTSLRFFAALIVMIFHTRTNLLEGPLKSWAAWLRPLADVGFVGVPFFFVLSGFILAYTYLGRAEVGPSGWKPGAMSRFYQARFARVYPLYVFALLLTLPIFLKDTKTFGAAFRMADALATVGLLQAWFPSFTLVWNAVGWSLSAEAFFYLVFPWISARAAKWDARSCAIWAVVCVAISAGATHVLLAANESLALPVGLRESQSAAMKFARYSPLLHLPEFCTGVFLGRWYLAAGVGSGPDRGRTGWLLLMGAGLLASAGLVARSARVPLLVLHNYAFVLPFGAIILASAALGGTIRLLSLKPLIFLGEASYALYLTHTWLLIVYLKAGKVLTGAAPTGPVHFLIYAAAAVGFASMTYLLVERPARRSLLARFGRSRPLPVG